MQFKEEVSVIIPTYNGAKKIKSLLAALTKQTFQNFKIYIGIDGSSDNTKEVLLGQTYFDKNRVFIYEQKNKGRSVIRNKTASFAKGQILVFLDDDMVPSYQLIEKHYKHHLKAKSSILGGGLLDIKVNNSDYLNFKSYLSNKWIVNYNNHSQLLNNSNLFLSAANFSIPKQLFKSINGFDERLKDIEDWDLVVRAFEKGINIYFDPTIKSYHQNLVTLREDIIRQREYNKALHILRELKPDLFNKKYDRIGKPKLDLIRKIIYWLIARKYIVIIIDNFNIFKILPQFLKYRLYTLTRIGLGRIYINRDI